MVQQKSEVLDYIGVNASAKSSEDLPKPHINDEFGRTTRMHGLWPSESAIQSSQIGGLFSYKDHLTTSITAWLEKTLPLSKAPVQFV